MKSQTGFTILEALVAMALLAVTMAGDMAMYFNADAIASLAAHKKMALELANSSMESCKQGTCPSTTMTIGGLSMTVATSAADVSGQTYKLVTGAVTWSQPGYPTQTMTLTTYDAP